MTESCEHKLIGLLQRAAEADSSLESAEVFVGLTECTLEARGIPSGVFSKILDALEKAATRGSPQMRYLIMALYGTAADLSSDQVEALLAWLERTIDNMSNLSIGKR